MSVYSGYFGAGSGIMLLALLLVLVDHRVPEANAIKNMLLGAATLASALVFVTAGPVDWTAVMPLAAGLFAGSAVGPVIARRVSPRALRWAVAGLGLALASRAVVASGLTPAAKTPHPGSGQTMRSGSSVGRCLGISKKPLIRPPGSCADGSNRVARCSSSFGAGSRTPRRPPPRDPAHQRRHPDEQHRPPEEQICHDQRRQPHADNRCSQPRHRGPLFISKASRAGVLLPAPRPPIAGAS